MRLALVVIVALIWHPSLPAADRVALVIGNDAYRNVAPLKNAKNDARLFARVLRDADFDVTVVEDADREQFWRAVDAFRVRIRKGDEAVVYYAGHGVQIRSDTILLPSDIRADNEYQVARDGIPLYLVQDALREARVSLLVVDACRDNPFPSQGTRRLGDSRGLAPVEAAEGSAVILAASRGQTALDYVPPDRASSNGLFTHVLAEVFRTPGQDVRSALLRARDKVDAESRKVGHMQRPALVDEMRGAFYFFPAPDSPAAGAAARLSSESEIEQQAWEAAQGANRIAVYQAYLREYPAGRFAASARIRIAALASPDVAAPASRANAELVSPAASEPPKEAVSGSLALAAPTSARTPTPSERKRTVGAWYMYRITDRFSGRSKLITLRLENVEGGRYEFNRGQRIEDVDGRALAGTQTRIGEFDLLEPPGGWVGKDLLARGKLSLDYQTAEGGSMDLRAVLGSESDITVNHRKHRVVRADFTGWATRKIGPGLNSPKHKISLTAWFDIALQRPVAFESTISVNSQLSQPVSSERVELVSRFDD